MPRAPTARRKHLHDVSTAVDGAGGVRVFRITHAFHPDRGRDLPIIAVKQAWGESRVFYHGDDGLLTSIPLAWTDLQAVRPAVRLGQGRVPFVAADLLALQRLIRGLRNDPEGTRHA